MNARYEQFRHPDTTPEGDTADTPVSDVSSDNEWAAKYREASERDRRFSRLLHTTAIVIIALFVGFFAAVGAIGLAARALIVGPIVYLLIYTVVGLFLQWRREMGVNDT